MTNHTTPETASSGAPPITDTEFALMRDVLLTSFAQLFGPAPEILTGLVRKGLVEWHWSDGIPLYGLTDAGRQAITERQTTMTDVDQPVSHDDARSAAQRLISGHFGLHPHARVCVPAQLDDDDVLLMRYIEQQARTPTPLSTPAETGNWQLVPKEPTQEMVRAGHQDQPGAINFGASSCYRAMLTAAPKPPQVQTITLPAEQYDAFVQALDQPADTNEKLKALLAGEPLPPQGGDAREIVKRLRHTVLTATNDDYSAQSTEKRDRHIARLEAIQDAIDFLESTPAPLIGAAAVFVAQQHGAVVATILETDHSIVEVLKRSDNQYELIIHSRRGQTDQWDDLSAPLQPIHFQALGSIAATPLPEEVAQLRQMLGKLLDAHWPHVETEDHQDALCAEVRALLSPANLSPTRPEQSGAGSDG
jgi:hypothetical protein